MAIGRTSEPQPPHGAGEATPGRLSSWLDDPSRLSAIDVVDSRSVRPAD
jgi:hypothetical protein